MVTVGSDQSFRILMDKLPKKQLNGQEPLVTHYSRHYFNQFEEQARKDMPSTGNNANNSNNHNDSFNPQQTGSFHHYNHNTSLGSNSVGGGNNHLNGNSNSINNVNSTQLHSQPIMQSMFNCFLLLFFNFFRYIYFFNTEFVFFYTLLF